MEKSTRYCIDAHFGDALFNFQEINVKKLVDKLLDSYSIVLFTAQSGDLGNYNHQVVIKEIYLVIFLCQNKVWIKVWGELLGCARYFFRYNY